MKITHLIIIVMSIIKYGSTSNQKCLWKDKDGHQYDLNSLSSSTNYKVGDEAGEAGMFNMIYEFNFCSRSVRCHDLDVVGIEALEVMGTVTENCDILGLQETQSIQHIDPLKPNLGIKIHYTGGDQCFQMKKGSRGGQGHGQDMGDSDMEMVPRSVSFLIKCASSDANQFTLSDNASCNLQFSIDHSLGCGSSSSNGQTTTWLIAIILLVGAYFAIGMFRNNKIQGLTGYEAIPHKEFWTDLPILIKDGINYSVQSIFNLIRQVQGKESRETYMTV